MKKQRNSNLQTAYQQLEQTKLDLEKQLVELAEEKNKLTEKFNLFNSELYKQKKLNKFLVEAEVTYLQKINLLEKERDEQATTIDLLSSELESVSKKIKNLIVIANSHIHDFNDKVVGLSNKQIMLSYQIGKTILDLKNLQGVKTILPRIIQAKKDLTRKEDLKLKKKELLNENEWIVHTRKLISKKPNLAELAASIPNSNGSAFYSKIPLKVAIITDEFMFNYYNGVFEELIYINPNNYKDVLAKNIDLFIYVSCWSGMLNDDWRGIKYREKPKTAFNEILDHCKKNRIKTVFQTIEDPSNYENFLPLAQQFDYVFTSAIEKVPDYIEACGHSNVFYGEYGFNPLLNNPIGLYRDVFDSVFFAGSYPQRYQDRCNDMHTMFDSVINSGGNLVIADRNFDLPDTSLRFPEKYQDYVIPKLEHKLLQRIHKLFRYNANFNSIKDSETMCAMRVYELQAQGALILSNYALSVSNNHPNVKIINKVEDLSPLFYQHNKIDMRELKSRVDLIRNMYLDKSVFDQTRKMLNMCGFGLEFDKPSVLVLQDRKFDFVDQSYAQYTLALKSEKNDFEDYDFVAYISEKETYSRHYLQDLLNGFKYVDVDFISKSNPILNDAVSTDIYSFVSSCKNIHQSIFKSSKFKQAMSGTYEGPGFIIEPSNIDHYILSKAPTSYELSVIIPVYNNGKFLRDRCLKSLQLDAHFSQFEVLLIDDGSTDNETHLILDELAQQYQNIKLYKFPAGGSGSASRARNKGIDIASNKLVTFLDPDNEISLNGYTHLLSIYREYKQKYPTIDFVTGYQNKINVNNIVRTAYHTDKHASYMKDPKAHLLAKKYPIISTQAFVGEIDLLRKNKIYFALNAVGQDTLFGHELMGLSNGCIFTGGVYINYYAERKGSVTNTLDIKFFKKSLELEKYQVDSLRKIGLFENYRDNKFKDFFENWYLEKLKLVEPAEAESANKILAEIKSLYAVVF